MPTYQQFHLPDAGEGLTEADIVTWHVAVGDVVKVNQTIVEIETAKSLVELPSPYAGVVTELLVEPGQTVDVGAPIIEVDTDPAGTPADDGAEFARRRRPGSPTRAAAARSSTGTADVPTATRASSPAVPTRSRRRVRAGPRRLPLAATAPSVAAAAGVVGRRRGGRGARRAAGRARRLRRGGGRSRLDVSVRRTVRPRATARTRWPSRPVRKLARELGVDLDSVTPTGPGGIVTREDVLGRAAQAEARTLATYPGDDAPWLASGTVSPTAARPACR